MEVDSRSAQIPTLDAVRVDKAQLITQLETNRDSHYSTYIKACEGFQNAVTAHLESNLKRVRKGGEWYHDIGLIKPSCYSRDYTCAIESLKWSKDDEVWLEKQDFRQLVLDDWGWKQIFTASASTLMVNWTR